MSSMKPKFDFILRTAALGGAGQSDSPAYLPKNLVDVMTFEAHRWVQNAVRFAYYMGLADAETLRAGDYPAPTQADVIQRGHDIAQGLDMPE